MLHLLNFMHFIFFQDDCLLVALEGYYFLEGRFREGIIFIYEFVWSL